MNSTPWPLPGSTPSPLGNDGVGFVSVNGFRLIAYPVAGRDGSLQPGRRQICFTWYDATRNALLKERQCLSPTGDVLATLTREAIPTRTLRDLRDQAQRLWPEPWRAFIVHALDHREIVATPVAEYFPERLHRSRLAIIGDAAHVVSPMTGRGFVAGLHDVEALAVSLKENFDQPGFEIPCALRCYEEKRLSEAQRLARASISWSRAFLLSKVGQPEA